MSDKEANTKEQEAEAQTGETVVNDENSDSTEELSEEQKKDNELKEYKDKFVRLYSEFENFRRRNAKERLELIESANSNLLKQILPIIDDFERAIKANESNEDIGSIKSGFELIHDKMLKTLISSGLEPMNSKGKEFNVDEHEALTKIPAPSKKDKGKVVDVIESGYFLNKKVLRFAKVVIGE